MHLEIALKFKHIFINNIKSLKDLENHVIKFES